jgi:hypothetical protein
VRDFQHKGLHRDQRKNDAQAGIGCPNRPIDGHRPQRLEYAGQSNVADARSTGLAQRIGEPGVLRALGGEPEGKNVAYDHRIVDVANANGFRSIQGKSTATGTRHRNSVDAAHASSTWDAAEWIVGHDGKARRVEPSIRLLAHGIPARVGRLRAYGNAIVPQAAAAFIGAYLDIERAAVSAEQVAA